jgi:serine/threonine kinase PknH
MSLFISYSRLDEDVVNALARGLEAAGVDVWRDHELHGGDSWWSVILERIRGCSAFVFALSDASVRRSKPCRAELEYAMALSKPVVPVQVGSVSTMRAMPLADRQVVPYRTDDATCGFAVLAAVHGAVSRGVPLPHPLPPPPPIPFGYLLALGRKIDIGNLAAAEQMRIIDDLRRALEDEHEESVRGDIVRMLEEMRRKSWTVVAADREIEKLLSSHDEPVRDQPVPQPGWYPDPTSRHQWRWFDRDWTPWVSDNGVVLENPL